MIGSPFRRRDFAILFVAAAALRLAYGAAVGGLGRFSGTGYTEYMLIAERLLRHGTLISPLVADDAPVAPSAMMPPAYAVLLAGLYGIFGVRSFAATLTAQLINTAAVSFAAVLAASVASRLAGRRAGRLAGSLVALHPALIAFTEYIWDTSLFVFAATLAVWWSLRLGGGGVRPFRWLGFGLFLGALALLNPALTTAYPLLVLWPVSRAGEWNRSTIARATGFTVLGWLIAIVPWTIRNYVQLGELLYVRSGLAQEFWLGVCPEADTSRGDVFPQQFALSNLEVRRTVTQLGESAYLKECGRRAADAIASDPDRFSRLVGLRSVDYWAGTVFTHTPRGGDHWPRSRSRAATLLFFLVETVLLVVLLVLRGRGNRDAPWLFGMLLIFSVIYCVTHVQLRYRVPMEPVVAILLGVLMVRSRHDQQSSDRSTAPASRAASA